MYNAQQAERDAQTKFNTVEASVYISLTETYGPFLVAPSISRSSTPGISLRTSDFWHEFKFRVFDGDDLREPASIYAEPQYRCVDDGGCLLVGSEIHLSLPAEAFTSDTATIEITSPDGQLVAADFNLATLR